METPIVVHKCIETITCTEDGGMLLSASSLTGRYWMGSMYYWSNKNEVPDPTKCEFKSDLNSGIADVCFIKKKFQAVAGTDSGVVQIWNIDRQNKKFECIANPCEHDNSVTSVDVNSSADTCISASLDKKIKVWNMEDYSCTNTYTGHYDAVQCVKFHPVENNVFLSAGQDKRLVLWDTRKPKPARLIDLDIKDIATCMQWQPGKEWGVVLGTESGNLIAADLRAEISTTATIAAHTRSVTRIEFSPRMNEYFATSSEDCTARILKLSPDRFVPQWETSKHTDFVRCATWANAEELFTCSWDGSVVRHTVTADQLVKNELDTMEINDTK